jgi:hypothetical protein
MNYSKLGSLEILNSVTLTTWHPLTANVDTNFADKRRSLADSGQGVFLSLTTTNVDVSEK